MLNYLITLAGLFVLVVGILDGNESLQNPESIPMTVSDYLKSDKSLPYVTLSDAKINLLKAVTIRKEKSDKIKLIYVPIDAQGFEQKDSINLLLETDDDALLELATTMHGLSAGEQLKYVAENRDKLICSRALSGKMSGKHGMDGDHRKQMHELVKGLTKDFQIMDHNVKPDVGRGVILLMLGLALLLFGVWRIKKVKAKKVPPVG